MMPSVLTLQDAQERIEYKFSKSNIKKFILDDVLETPVIMEKVNQGVELLKAWIAGGYRDPQYDDNKKKQAYYDKKEERLRQLVGHDLEDIIMDVLAVVLPLEKPMLFTSVVGQLVGTLGYTSKLEGTKTIAEILAVLCETDLFDIGRNNSGSLTIKSCFVMDEKLKAFIAQTQYLPPMICAPRIVKKNWDSGYLTRKESLILKDNHHDQNICLDSINKFNQVELSLDLNLLKTYNEPPTDFDTKEKREEWQALHPGECWQTELQERIAAWDRMVRDSYRVYLDLAKQGNKFWLTHKVDKRGRTYAQGYHVSTQGSAFKKAIVNLNKKELITGV